MRRILSTLMLMLLTATLRAAEPETDVPDAAEEDSDTAALEAEDAALAEEIRAAEEALANAPPADRNEPFVPTVQISEDLSVSFPVDI